MKKPFVAVIGSFSEMVPGHVHLRELADYVKQGVIEAGGVRLLLSVTDYARGIRECVIHLQAEISLRIPWKW